MPVSEIVAAAKAASHCLSGQDAFSLTEMGFKSIVVIDGDYASIEEVFSKGV